MRYNNFKRIKRWYWFQLTAMCGSILGVTYMFANNEIGWALWYIVLLIIFAMDNGNTLGKHLRY